MKITAWRLAWLQVATCNWTHDGHDDHLCAALFHISNLCSYHNVCSYVGLNDLQDKNGNTALIRASSRGYVEAAGVLLDHGANIDHQDQVSAW